MSNIDEIYKIFKTSDYDINDAGEWLDILEPYVYLGLWFYNIIEASKTPSAYGTYAISLYNQIKEQQNGD